VELCKIESNTINDCIYSVILFIGDSTFKTKMPDNVRFARGGIEYIKNKRNIVFNSKEVGSIIDDIESARLEASFKTNIEHIKHVREILKQKPDTKACSKCGSDMLLRMATKGINTGNEFWGCSTFPKCRNVIESNDSK
jgi:restriction system protein